ncbi:hypothetical protein ACLBV4_32095, partial [Pseudomonas aeruginosa]
SLRLPLPVRSRRRGGGQGGLERMRVVATKRKLGTLGGRPLLVDSGDPALDDSFPDAIRVWAGYKEELLYPLGYGKDQDAPAGA